ncbi:hypothetical protein HELRODRAFT_181415 [Helobdella robusta]|uniref:Uncharacterized protein n=1 Tax=Helobdella robusta TaxID=6412 RepID=T1FGZ3_HELRO|nr:hypothetical protein HELRODRAFT_181415 [Helobdella robusta]ESN92539.1 hypothetical protein HELRODRAFT_181415 [Helobdella robusta]
MRDIKSFRISCFLEEAGNICGMLRSFHKIRRCHLLRNFGVQHLLNEQHNNKPLLSESGCSYKEINHNTSPSSSSSSQGDKRSYNYKNKNYYKKFNLNVDHWFHNCQLNFLEAVGLGTAIIAGLRLSCEVDELKKKCYKKKDVQCTNFCPVSHLKNVTSLFLNNWNDIYPSPLGNLYNQLFNDSCNIIASNLARRGFYKKATMIWTEVLARDPLHLKALYNLAVCHERGLGLQCHLQKAIELYRVAAEHGHIASCHKLAQLYKTIKQPVANDEDDNDEAKLHKKEKYLYYPTKASKPGSLEASRVIDILKFKSDNLIGALQSVAINNNECVETNHCLKLCKQLADDADDSDGAFKCDEEMSAIKLTSNSQIVTKSKQSSLSSPQSSPSPFSPTSFDCPYSSHLVKSSPTSLSFLPPLSIKFNLSNGYNGYMIKDEQNYELPALT